MDKKLPDGYRQGIYGPVKSDIPPLSPVVDKSADQFIPPPIKPTSSTKNNWCYGHWGWNALGAIVGGFTIAIYFVGSIRIPADTTRQWIWPWSTFPSCSDQNVVDTVRSLITRPNDQTDRLLLNLVKNDTIKSTISNIRTVDADKYKMVMRGRSVNKSAW